MRSGCDPTSPGPFMAMWFALLKWLFGSWWSLPPNTPTRLRATVNTSTIRINWDCPTSSKWNSDSFELQVRVVADQCETVDHMSALPVCADGAIIS